MKNKIIIALGAIVIILASYILGTLNPQKADKTEISTAVVESSVHQLAELTTLEYNYTNLGKYENSVEFYGWKIPFTTSRLIFSYQGTIKVAVDLSKAQITVQEDKINIKLPNSFISSHTIDYDSLEVLDESYSVFNPIRITDYNRFYQDQAKAMEQKALEKGVLKSARDNAISTIETMLKTIYPQAEITFS